MKRNSFHLQINLYKESKDFPLSGVDMPIYYEERTIKRILEVLKPTIVTLYDRIYLTHTVDRVLRIK